MPEQLTPVIREEEYLAAIAGREVTPPDPATRKEDWLDAIADNVTSLASNLSTAEGEIDDLQDIAPTPEAADSGKVLTAGADGTGSWQASVTPVPAAADSGKVLKAGADGTASWQTTGDVYTISQGLTTALLGCVQSAVTAAVTGNDNLAYGSDSGQQVSSESDTETAFAAAKAFFNGGSVKLSFPGIGVKLSPTTAYWSDSDVGYALTASIGGIIPAYSIPFVGTGFVQWNMNVASQLDGENNPVYGYDIYVAVSINKAAGSN